LIDISSGGTPSKGNPAFWTGNIPWISPKDMKKDFLDDSEDHISETAISESASRLVPANSILVVVRGMILAKRVPIAIALRDVAINQDMKGLSLKPDSTISPLFLYAALKSRERLLFSHVSTAAHGTKKLDTDRLLGMRILMPDSWGA
jgi:type I restriction enzyme, S subunit